MKLFSRKRIAGRMWSLAVLFVVVGAGAAPAGAAAAPPTVAAQSISAVEGAPFSGTVATFTDAPGKGPCLPVDQNYTATVAWGDGAQDSADVSFVSGPDKSNLCHYQVDAKHAYTEEQQTKLEVSVNGPGSATPGGDSAAVVVADAPLSSSSSAQHATTGIVFNGTVATFTDADPGGAASDYTAVIDWGDGGSSTASVTGAGPFAVAGSHTFKSAGSFDASVTITDAGGSRTSTHFTITVSTSASGLIASLKLASGSGTHPGQAVTFDASGSTAPAGSRIIAYRWDFNNDGVYDADTGAIPQATHYFATAGTHTVGLQVEDSSGRFSGESDGSVVLAGTTPGCRTDLQLGFLEFVAGCITNNAGVYSIDLNDPARHSVGASLLGVSLTSDVPGAQLQLDTTGSDEPHGTNPDHKWVLRSTAPVEVAIQNSSIGTIDLFSIPLNTSPVFLPVGADAPDQNADGLRVFTAEAQSSSSGPGDEGGCPDHAGYPPVACATLPGGFPLTGSISLYAQPALAPGDAPGAAIETSIELHAPIHITGDIALHGNASDGIQIDHFGFRVQNIDVGIGTIDSFQLTYDRMDNVTHDMDVYEGMAQMSLRVPGNPQVSGDIRFANGGFQRASFELTHANVPLGPVILNRLGGGFGVDPFHIEGSLGGTVGPFSVGAGVEFTAATSTAPWHFGLDGVSVTYLNIINATGSLALDGDGFVGGDLTLSAGLPSYNDPHRWLSLAGNIHGFAYNGLFQIGGGIQLDAVIIPASCPFCLHLHGTVQGFVNNNPGYAAGCGSLTIDPGGINASAWARIRLSDGNFDWGFGDCANITPFCTPPSALGPHAGETGTQCLAFASTASVRRGPQRVALPAGRSADTLLIRSASGVPAVRISGPSGTYTTPARIRLPYLSAAIPDQHELEIVIYHGRPGIYTVTPLAGSPPVARVLESHSLPAPAVHVRVRGTGARRKLVYAIALNRGIRQRVVFTERGKDVAHVIGQTIRSHGVIRFVPELGKARTRTIVAQLYNNGIPQMPRTVGRYTAPAPAAPGRPRVVRIVRGRNEATIRWTAAANATGYEVTISAGDGRHVLYVLSARKRRLTVKALFPEFGLRASVAATGGLLREPGRTRTARLQPRRG